MKSREYNPINNMESLLFDILTTLEEIKVVLEDKEPVEKIIEPIAKVTKKSKHKKGE